jgi:proteasome lid subunit RPN8/RPN11
MLILKPKLDNSDISSTTPPKVTFQANAFDKMMTYFKSEMSIEQGGFLLGKSNLAGDLKITDFLPALHTIAKNSSFQFTTQTWNDYDDRKREKFSNLKLIGWAHTHLGLGVFLSPKDKTVNMFFDYIAVVVDPLKREIGFFYLKSSPEALIPIKITGKSHARIDFQNYEIEERN